MGFWDRLAFWHRHRTPAPPQALSDVRPVAAAGTTLMNTLVLGPAGRGGYRPIVVGPGEPYLRRTDLLPKLPAAAPDRRPVLAFAQLTDIHTVDAQSPARVEYLDRYAGPGVAVQRAQPDQRLLPATGDAVGPGG